MQLENTPELWKKHLPWPGPESHKYTRGHVLVAAGPAQKSGAAKLAARAALRTGAGLCTLLCPPDALTVYATWAMSVMVEAVADDHGFAKALEDERRNTLVIGPGHGVGETCRQRVLTALRMNKRTVIDADAITSFKGATQPLFEAIAQNTNAVLTPHEGEFERLFTLTDDRAQSASAAAKQSHAVIVLKGATTVITAPDGRIATNTNAPAWLATAGAGDVLSGMIGGLLAQSMPPFEAAAAAVWMHGEAASLHGPGLIAEEIEKNLPKVLHRLYERR